MDLCEKVEFKFQLDTQRGMRDSVFFGSSMGGFYDKLFAL